MRGGKAAGMTAHESGQEVSRDMVILAATYVCGKFELCSANTAHRGSVEGMCAVVAALGPESTASTLPAT